MNKKLILIPAIALSSLLTSISALEWSELGLRVPVAGKDTGTGVYVRKRNTGYTDTYSNFFGGSTPGSYWEGKYRNSDPKYMRDFQMLSYDGTVSNYISKLIIRSEGWSTLESSDSRWEGEYYSAMMPIGNGTYQLHATNKGVNGSQVKETNNPYVYVKSGDTLIIGNGAANTGIVFDWKPTGYNQEVTLETQASVDVRGMLLSHIKVQQDGNEWNKLNFNMKVSGDGSYRGVVDINTKNYGSIEKLGSIDYAYEFDKMWNSKNNYKKADFHKVEFSTSSTYDVSGYKAQFLVGNAADTIFYLTGQFRGGNSLEIHAREGGRALVMMDSRPVTIGTLSGDHNSKVNVTHMSNLTINNLAFGVWDDSIGVISGGVTNNGYIGIESRANVTINAFRGNMNSNGSNPTVVELMDRKGVVYTMKDSMDRVRWKLGTNTGTTLNLYGTNNRLTEVYGVGGDKSLTIYHHTDEKTITGIDALGVDVLNSGKMTVTTTARGRNKSDIFYVNRTENPANGSVTPPKGTISLIPTIKSEQDRKSVEGAIIGYTPNNVPGFVKEFNWNPNNGILKRGFKIVLDTFKQGNNHTGWMIKDYILIGVDDKENIDFDPDEGFNCGPGYECGQLDPEMGKPDVDNDAGFNPGLEPDLDKPEPEPEPPKPDPEPNPGPGEGEKPDPTPPEGGDGNGGTKPPTEGGDNGNGGTKPPVTPPEGGDNGNGGTKPPEPEKPVEPDQPVNPDPKPEIPGDKPDPNPNPGPGEGGEGEDKPKPPVQNESVFTETFKQTVADRVQKTKSLFLVNFNSINKRLGDLRGNDNEHGVWTRGFVGGHDNDTFYTIQVGYDNQILKTEKYSLYLGTAGSYSRDSVTNMGELAMYMSYIQDNGWYNDTIVKFAMMNSKSVVNDFMHYGVVFSDEIGYRFNINGWFIDPQVELSLGYLTGADFQDVYHDPVSGAKSIVNASFTDSIHFRARFGASTGYNHVFEDKGIKLQAYAGLFGEVDKFTQSKGRVGAYGFEEIYGAAYQDDIRMVLNVGTNVDFRDAGRLYVDFEKSFLGNFNIDWKVNVGYRYAFGKKDVAKEDKPESKEDITPIKLKEDGKDNLAKEEESKKTQPSKVEKVAKKDTAKKTTKATKAKTKGAKVAKKTSKSTKAKAKVETKPKAKVAKVEKKKSDGWFLK